MRVWYHNRLLEVLTLFGSITNSQCFLETSIISFINKTDLFTKNSRVYLFLDYQARATRLRMITSCAASSLSQSMATRRIYAHCTPPLQGRSSVRFALPFMN